MDLSGDFSDVDAPMVPRHVVEAAWFPEYEVADVCCRQSESRDGHDVGATVSGGDAGASSS